jgi:CspA family cold shock protein
MQYGTVKWFDYRKGYGFIEPSNGSRDLFLHIRAVERAGIESLEPGQRVSFEIERQKGKLSAINIELIK